MSKQEIEQGFEKFNSIKNKYEELRDKQRMILKEYISDELAKNEKDSTK